MGAFQLGRLPVHRPLLGSVASQALNKRPFDGWNADKNASTP